MNEPTEKVELGADSSAAPCLVIPAGNPEDGWTTDWDLIKSIAAEVRQKSGDQILLESLDDVIIALQRRGYVKVAPNA